MIAAYGAGAVFTPYSAAKPVLDSYRDRLPEQLRNPNEAKWAAWTRAEDKSIRARLHQGELDSLANFVLFGASFTKQPRIKIDALSEANKSGLVQARIDDLVSGLRNPGENERLIFIRDLLRRDGIDPASAEAGKFIYSTLARNLQERRTLSERAAQAKPASILDRASVFYDRGLSLDTSILPDFSIDRTLADLKQRGILREGQVGRVAVIGPGLDFIDKNDESAFDYYPPQTLQPFAVYDSLLRLGLAQPGLSLSILDISPRVIDHIQRARERARKNVGYEIQLPHDVSRAWSPDLSGYWSSFGEHVGGAVKPARPPGIFSGLQTRAVRVRPDVVLSCEPADVNIVLQRLNLPASQRFDLIIATNIFVYYDPFEQALGLQNAGAMLRPGGLLLTNDKLPEIPSGVMRQAGVTVVSFDDRDPAARDAVGWYQRK
ncbi:MAG: hypothetical protein JO307_23660 [Bryobacterales bacterium]|nr:hypothetical protein [Bryobacterales bacterium]